MQDQGFVAPILTSLQLNHPSQINSMNMIQFSRIATVTAISLWVLPAQAFTIGGQASYSSDSLPTELSVNNEIQVADRDTQFTVLAPDTLDIRSIVLEGTSGEFDVTENSTYGAVSPYITGFEFLGQAASFNLFAGENVLVGLSASSRFTLSSEITGEVVDLDGNFLGTATGSLSSIQTGGQSGIFSITLDGTPTSLDTTNSTSVPDPSVLAGLLAFLPGICCIGNRKRDCHRKQQVN